MQNQQDLELKNLTGLLFVKNTTPWLLVKKNLLRQRFLK